MAAPPPVSSSSPVPASQQNAPAELFSKRPHRLAALLSALLPGAGQLLARQIGAGLLFLALWALWLAAFYPLRVPRTYWGWVLLLVSGVVLTETAAFRALRANTGGVRRVSTPMLGIVLLVALISGIAWQYAAMRTAGFRFVHIATSAMAGTIAEGDRIVADTQAFRHAAPQRGELVLTPTRGEAGRFTVRRVIGAAGDTVFSRQGQLYVNGQPLSQPYVDAPGVLIPAMENFAPVTVPPDEVFVMGDNRDGRMEPKAQWFGLVKDSSIQGEPLYIFDSVNDREGNIRPGFDA